MILFKLLWTIFCDINSQQLYIHFQKHVHVVLQVIHHDSIKLGRSKEEFLEINGPQMATTTHVVVLVTEASATSPFVFHEVLFADWLGKKLSSAVFKNVWITLRPSLKAVLGTLHNILALERINVVVFRLIKYKTFAVFSWPMYINISTPRTRALI